MEEKTWHRFLTDKEREELERLRTLRDKAREAFTALNNTLKSRCQNREIKVRKLKGEN